MDVHVEHTNEHGEYINEYGPLYVIMCPQCGQPMSYGTRCNSGIHQGPGDGNDTGPFAVKSVDLMKAVRDMLLVFQDDFLIGRDDPEVRALLELVQIEVPPVQSET